MRMLLVVCMLLLFSSNVFAAKFQKIEKFKSPILAELLDRSFDLIGILDERYAYEHAVNQVDLYKVTLDKKQSKKKMLKQFVWRTYSNNPIWEGYSEGPWRPDTVEVHTADREMVSQTDLMSAYDWSGDVKDWSDEVKAAFKELFKKVQGNLFINENLELYHSFVNDDDTYTTAPGALYFDTKTNELLHVNTALNDH